jgi:predicted oxidoreductase
LFGISIRYFKISFYTHKSTVGKPYTATQIPILQVLVDLSHAHEDIFEDTTEIRAEGALDADSEAGCSIMAWSGLRMDI